jgi:hypothetical protein
VIPITTVTSSVVAAQRRDNLPGWLVPSFSQNVARCLDERLEKSARGVASPAAPGFFDPGETADQSARSPTLAHHLLYPLPVTTALALVNG